MLTGSNIKSTDSMHLFILNASLLGVVDNGPAQTNTRVDIT